MMKVHIKVVVSTAGTDEEYVGKHLGLKLLGRPLERMVVTFEEHITEEEYEKIGHLTAAHDLTIDICRSLFINQAIKVHSFSVTRNVNH